MDENGVISGASGEIFSELTVVNVKGERTCGGCSSAARAGLYSNQGLKLATHTIGALLKYIQRGSSHSCSL